MTTSPHGGRPRSTRGEAPRPFLRAPIDAPDFALSPPVVRLFNEAIYRKQFSPLVRQLKHYDPFFYPLDAVLDWNRIYGKRGFFQYQCVVPPAAGRDTTRALLTEISDSGQGSFLVVLKTFGAKPSPGLLSFPRPGFTLALDFPNAGPPTLDLMTRLDAIVSAVGGAIYPAKDARMSPSMFRASFPRLDEFRPHIDPKFSSSLWRRLAAG